MAKSFFGVIGLGVMGRSISLNIAEKGYPLSVYNRDDGDEEGTVLNFINSHQEIGQKQGFTQLEPFVSSLEKPRKILMMIKAGKVVDHVLEKLTPLMEDGDIIIDGGNSHFLDTERRSRRLSELGLNYVGCGVSGGEKGARYGPSIMPGGDENSYDITGPVLESIAAKDDNGQACCTHIGPGGSGHFVKMVHNGIEYGEMQLLAELYAVLKTSHDNQHIADIFASWNEGELSSYLLEITIDILRKKEGDNYLLDMVLDKAGNKGTGSWSSKAAFDLGSVNTMMSDAVFARYISSFKSDRQKLSSTVNRKHTTINIGEEILKSAYRASRILNHHQGFELIRQASDSFAWDLRLHDIARIWTNGCIIRSALMKRCIGLLVDKKSLLDHQEILQSLGSDESDLSQVIHLAIDGHIAVPVFSSSLQYWIAMTTDTLPANLIQAQRDYFGAHTYQRTDDPSGKYYHSNWE